MNKKILILTLISFSIVNLNCNVINKKADTLDLISEAMDFENLVVRNLAAEIASEREEGEFNIRQVCEIYSYVRKNWKYVNDPKGKEFFSSASNTISVNFKGDCDDFAILLASMIRAIGGEVRTSFAFNEKSGHAFTEVFLKDAPKKVREEIEKYYRKYFMQNLNKNTIGSIGYREAENGGIWLNLDWLSSYVGGVYFDYDRCDIFYPISMKTETVLKSDNLVKDDGDNVTEYTAQNIANQFNQAVVLGEGESIDVEPKFILFDVDGNQVKDLLAYYTISSGGNLTIQRLIVCLNDNGKFAYYTYYDLVGDYDNTFIENVKNSVINAIQYIYKDDDPRCCPSLKKEIKFRFIVKDQQLYLQGDE